MILLEGGFELCEECQQIRANFINGVRHSATQLLNFSFYVLNLQFNESEVFDIELVPRIIYMKNLKEVAVLVDTFDEDNIRNFLESIPPSPLDEDF